MLPDVLLRMPKTFGSDLRRRTLALLGPLAPDHGQTSTDSDVRVRILSAADIVTARQQGRALAEQLGFSNSNRTIIATAISEIVRNVVTYAQDGEVRMTRVEDSRRRGVRVVVADRGPGIPDVSAAMRDGYSTGQGLGIGLPGSRRLMDDFEIVSTVGEGTTVTMTKWIP